MALIDIEICMGSACYLLGAQDLLEAIESLSAEKKAKIDLRGATCLKACGSGPNIKIDGVLMSNITPKQLLDIINEKIDG
ncbi:(2Fe-2S) ferredoxin domain-containing protein [bacterium BFN5]|jgi:NADH:ubiquinone oxidoreductase subunit E|nr:(2Fe-2S) ferredoxin domain-containing protein [bacterium BFN5]GBG55099.1 NADH dehydrogenase [Sporomusaceae bacterium FL31]GCE33225.1 NADH dehydrogenase [Sporomusaceae bacterium]